jgi:hypothetical protein
MAKNWWFKFEWNDWLGDEELSACSLETQGLWIKCLCLMYRANVAELVGTIDQLRRRLGVLPEELTRCLQDLKANNAANVRFGNGEVSIVSRRREKDLKHKEDNRLYVARHREKTACKDDVRTQSKSKSLEQEKEQEEEKKADKPLSRAPKKSNDEFLADLKAKPVYSHIDIDSELSKATTWAAANNRQVTQKFFVNWINRIDKPMQGMVTTNATSKPTSEREKSASRVAAGYAIADELEREARAEMETLRLVGHSDGPADDQPGERPRLNGNGIRLAG